MKQLKFIDLFAGIGGFRLALESLNLCCVFSSEWDKPAQDTYQNNFNETPFGDITKIDSTQIPDHDILCAGFPCQSFSISGKQLGFKDQRGMLFLEILRIAKAKKPKVIFLENVSNLKQHDNGKTFQTIKKLLTDANYFVEEKIFNAKDFGLAQSRSRIIIVASLNKPFDFGKIKVAKKAIVLKDIIDESCQDSLEPTEYTILDPKLWKKQKSGLIFCGYRNKELRKNGTRPNTEHLSRVHKQPNRIYHVNGTHPTLSSQELSGRFFIYDGTNVRKLTIKECYKLQGFPSSYLINPTRSEAYRQIGNSVPIKLIRAVAKQIIAQFF